ncbi:hypothetical protein [Neptunomonas sp.]|uniref:hypothetical protein n=1 Tax=Neptunomonas sp. TaxID=1971898 RepID=UPI00356B2C35
MEYQKTLANINQLAESTGSKELQQIKPVALNYALTTLTDPQEVINKLQAAEIDCGWITWPDEVQRIETGDALNLDHTMAPLEAELLLKNGNSLRLNYRNKRWNWLEITLNWLDSADEADALADRIHFESREKGQAPLGYARIWEDLPQSGMTTTDAIFIGFTGGNP